MFFRRVQIDNELSFPSLRSYVIIRFKAIIKEAMDTGRDITEKEIILQIAREIREGRKQSNVAKTFEEILSALPFGLSNLKFLSKLDRYIESLDHSNKPPEYSEALVKKQLSVYRSELLNKEYKYFDIELLNLTCNEMDYLMDKEYLIDIEQFLPDTLEVKSLQESINEEVRKFLLIYSPENIKTYAVVAEDIVKGDKYRTYDNHFIELQQIWMVTYFKVAQDTVILIACVEGRELHQEEIDNSEFPGFHE